MESVSIGNNQKNSAVNLEHFPVCGTECLKETIHKSNTLAFKWETRGTQKLSKLHIAADGKSSTGIIFYSAR